MKLLEGLIAAILAVFAPIQMIIITTIILVFADLITGLVAAYKRGDFKNINDIKSSGLRRTVTKILVYLSAICLGFLVETVMLEGYLALSKIIAGLVSIVELKSILENLDAVNGSPLFKSLIKRLGSVNDEIKEDVIEKITEKDEEK
jgi:phage-related holin